MKKIIIVLSILSLFAMGQVHAGLLGITIVAHSSGVLIATGSGGYIAGSMAFLSAAGPVGWIGIGLFGTALIIF